MIEVWIGRAGKRNGPYPRAKVLAAHGAGKLQPTDLLWWQGLGSWEPVATAIAKLAAVDDADPQAIDLPETDGGLALEPIEAPAAAPRPASATAPLAPQARGAGEGMRAASGAAPAPARPRERDGSATPDVEADETARLADAPFAGFWIRFVAVIIDGILVAIAQGLVVALVVAPWRGMASDAGLIGAQLLGLVIAWVYSAGFESSRWRATPGKRVLGLRVAGADAYERISFLRATGRFFARFLSWMLLMIGYLMQPFTARRQALHDMIAGTVVVRVS